MKKFKCTGHYYLKRTANILVLVGNGGVGLFLLSGGGTMSASAGSSLSSQSFQMGKTHLPSSGPLWNHCG